MGPDKFVCPGDSAYLFGPPGYSYSWSTGSSQQGIWVPLGSYNLVVTTGNGCQSSDSINVLPKFIAKPNLGPDTAICVGSNILLVAPGGYSTYQWTGGPSAASWLVGPGTYELEVGDANLCKAKDTIVVSTTSQPAFLGNDTTLCTSDTLIISPGLNYASYTWCGGDTTVYDTITQAGMYCVFTVDTNGCTSSDSIFVTYSSVTANFSYSKNNLAISFSPLDTNAATYLWNFGDSTATSSVMNPNHQYAQAGIYHVCLTVIDSAGCSKTTCDSVIVGNVAATSMLFDQISLYPNPTTGIVYFYSTKTFPKTLKWTVFDGTGREIQNADWDGKEELLIDLSDRSSGIYYLRIEGFNKAFRIQLD